MDHENPVLTLTPNEMQHLRQQLVTWVNKVRAAVNSGRRVNARVSENFEAISNLEKRTRRAKQDDEGNFRFSIPLEDVWIVEETLGQRLTPRAG